MKKQLVARIKMYGKSLFFTTTTVLVLNIAANAQATTSETSESGKAVITHLESKETSSLFNVKYPNESGEKFSLIIRDASGMTLYNGVFDDINFDKKFLITDIDKDARLTFTISPVKGKKSQTFETAAVSRVIDDVVVTRLK